MIDVAVLGSTGSIGTQTLEVIATEPERFRVSALSAHGSVELIAQQAAEVHPDVVVITDESRAADLAADFPSAQPSTWVRRRSRPPRLRRTW